MLVLVVALALRVSSFADSIANWSGRLCLKSLAWKINMCNNKRSLRCVCANKPVGRHSGLGLLCPPNAHFRNACKNVCRKAKQQKVKRNHCEGTKSFLRSEGKSPNHAFCAHRMRGLSNWSRRICVTNPYSGCKELLHWRGRAHQTKHSVGTECAIQECMQKCFKQLKAAKREAWTQRMAAWRRLV
jgi:hypothetical protein